MTHDQLAWLFSVLTMVAIGLYFWVYEVSQRINCYADRVLGPAWLTLLLLGIASLLSGFQGNKDWETLIVIGVACLFISGWIYLVWLQAFDEESY